MRHSQAGMQSALLALAGTWFTTVGAQNETEKHSMLQLSTNEHFHFEILLPLGEAIHNGADIGPLLGVANDIVPGDMDSFSEVFYELANKTKSEAEDPAFNYDPANVRDTWFSAATYFRRADFYLHGNWENPLINHLWDEQISAFDKGLAALPIPGRRYRIPADNFTVEAIWYSAGQECSKKRPTLILGNGYDGSQEDMYHTVVVPALARGWNCITYEGPGHPSVRRRQNLGFIHDWERVVTPVVDFLLENKEGSVDTNNIALFGYSFGGYHAARAAAFEPRISQVILNGGVWDTYDAYSSQLPPGGLEMFESGDKEGFDKMAQEILANPNTPTQVRWGLEQGLWSFNIPSAFDWFEETKLHTIKDVVDQIKVPVWIADAEFEGFFPGQSDTVAEALGDLATHHVFTGSAGYHCQAGALQEMNRHMFAWLHSHLN